MQNNNPKALGGMICGIVSLVFLLIGFFVWFFCFLGLIAGVVGLILSIMAKKEMPSTYATAGLIMSIIGLALNALIGVSCAICYCAAMSAVNNAYGSLGELAELLG